ncbi:MAG: hypothetical protein A3F82_00040 [Deltaproteobacteria bacterium RIFCSPLOWO2_12_FULL_44_12]|nr:MAG: hypothetical protein A3F82_00040 [Deltaproteobacteria bacterium RIFCSPLOWO2_12_FULL_44_12]
MKVDGVIEGYIERGFFVSLLNLNNGVHTTHFQGSSEKNLSVLGKTVPRVQAQTQERGEAKMTLEETRAFFEMSVQTLRKIEGDKHFQKGLHLEDKHLEFYRHILRETETALSKDQGLTIRMSLTSPEDKKDYSKDPKTLALMRKYKLLSPEEAFQGFYLGSVTDYYDGGKKNHLVVIFSNRHDWVVVQQEIRQNIAKLHERGLRLQGVEGLSGERSYLADYKANPSKTRMINIPTRPLTRIEILAAGCAKDPESYLRKFDEKQKPLPADLYMECLLGDAILTIGVEDRNLVDQGISLSTRSYPNPQLAPFQNPLLDVTNAYERGLGMAGNLTLQMERHGALVASLSYGAEHAEEIKRVLKEKGFNYIEIWVPSLRLPGNK